jgi:glutamyl-tRNA(Gln) amidotransferase subunit D
LAKKIAIGNKVKITTRDSKTYEGHIMPSTDNQTTALKLSSGYNLGLLNSNIKSIKVIKAQIKKKTAKKQLRAKHSNKLSTISIIHTGGTIASEVDYETGAVVAKFTPEEILNMFPELRKICNINSYLLSNMFSEDMRFAHYNLLAKAVQKEAKKGVEGIIITQGTDTLAYTAAALSFALEGLNVPVILVGAQRSSDRGSSDAFLNLICASQYIIKSDFCDVGICMHESSEDKSCLILPATKTKKIHSSRRDAFKPINSIPIARIRSNGKYENITPNTYTTKKDKLNSKIKIMPFKENIKIGLLKAHPNMFAKEIQNYSNFNGLIIEGTGLGHIAVNETSNITKENKRVLNSIKTISKKIPIFMTSQTTFGRVNMNVYSSGRILKKANVLGDQNNILSETAFIKMAWLLSNYPKNRVSKLMMENLRGELTERTLEKEFL